MAKTKKKTKTAADKKAYGEGKERRVSAKRKKTRLKREMAKERIEEQGFERKEGLVCMGDRCWIHNLLTHEYSNKNQPSGRCPRKKKGKKCDAMF